MNQPRPVESTVVGRPRFWVGPLVAGCCFAMGFGVTNRVVSLQSDRKPAQTQLFAPSYFPGDSLQNLRSIHQGDVNVQVDLAARKPASPELDAAVLSSESIPDLDPTPASASALIAPPPEVLPPSFVAENDAQQLLPLEPLTPPSLP